ncbi:MAG: GntR family transcriptional regulator [Pleurocapsa sp. SU_196_0]|nr:GntR family transcriptional regulator [Pleurocapsa sp. SU_196_0]
MTPLQDLARDTMHRSRTTPDAVSSTLREAIVRGVLRAAQPLKADDIAAQLGVSHIPVREALRQLEAEGLVTIYPNRGAIVASLSEADILEIYDIRTTLETAALEHSLPHLSPATLRRAARHPGRVRTRDGHASLGRPGFGVSRDALRAGLPTALAGDHQHLAQSGGSVLSHLPLAVKERLTFQRDHRRILEACQAGDLDGAVTALQTHLERTARTLVTGLGSGSS